MKVFFWTLVLLSQVLGITSVALLATWLTRYTEGYTWDCSNGVGGFHYLIMTIGMGFLYGEGMLSFRVCHRLGLPYLAEKAIHATIQSVVIVLLVVGAHASFLCKDAQSPPEGKDLYSAHSWIGMATILIFFGQWIYGIVMTVALRVIDRSWQDLLLPNHAFFGLLTFALSIGSCLTGANEMAIYIIDDYSHVVPSGHMVNAFAICLIAFAAVTAYIAYKPDFQIPESRRHPEDNAVPTSDEHFTSGSGKTLDDDEGNANQTCGVAEQTSLKELNEKLSHGDV